MVPVKRSVVGITKNGWCCNTITRTRSCSQYFGRIGNSNVGQTGYPEHAGMSPYKRCNNAAHNEHVAECRFDRESSRRLYDAPYRVQLESIAPRVLPRLVCLCDGWLRPCGTGEAPQSHDRQYKNSPNYHLCRPRKVSAKLMRKRQNQEGECTTRLRDIAPRNCPSENRATSDGRCPTRKLVEH